MRTASLLGLTTLMLIGCRDPDVATTATSTTAATTATATTAAATTAAWFTTGQAADLTLSAIGFDDTGGPLLFNHPGAVVTDGTHLALADRNNNRVLLWNTLPDGDDEPDLVLGQRDFTSNASGTGLDGMNWPLSMSIGGGKLVVGDAYNHRILVWNSIPTTSGQPADLEITGSPEQPIEWPWGVWTDGTRLVVSNTPRHEVLLWDSFPTSPTDAADLRLTGGGRLGTPRSITSDGTHLLIGDHNAGTGGAEHGVLNATFVWTSWPTSDREPDLQLDEWLQGEFTDDGKLLMVSSTGRSLSVWDSVPTQDGATPDLLVGGQRQGFDFDAGDGSDVAIAGEQVFVSLANGNRIVVYDTLPTAATDEPDGVIGAPDITTNTLVTNAIISNPDPVTDGTSLFALSDFDRKLYAWWTIPEQSGTHPDFVYELADQPRSISLAGGRLVVATRAGLTVWNSVPRAGEPADATLPALAGTEPRDIGGVAYDGTYLYVTVPSEDQILVWDGLPTDAADGPEFTLSARQPTAVESDGTYVAVMLDGTREVGIYRVADLDADATPSLVANPGHDGQGAFDLAASALVADGHLFVAETNRSRVLVWNDVAAAIAGEPFDVILGEDDPDDRTPEIGADHLFWPARLAFDGRFLWVGEFKFSERLLRFSVGTP